MIKLMRHAALLMLAGTAAWVLYNYPPEAHAFYPRCVLHQTTGWQCPGCGGLRAAHALLHGNVAAAFRHNPVVTVLGPLLLAWVAVRWVLRALGFAVMNLVIRPLWWWVLGALAAALGFGRNLWGPH